MTAITTDSQARLRPEIERIIAAGRPVAGSPAVGSLRSACLLAAISLLILWCCFTPLEIAPLAWIALVPLSQLIRLRTLPRRCVLWLWLTAVVWAVATLQWMRLGHPAMYLALAALACYLAMYIPAFVLISRRCVSAGFPLWITVPVVWTSLEFARAYLLTGFSWYYLGHSQYRWLSLIQISDITGAYGVSFVVALVSGALAERVPLQWLRNWQLDAELPAESAPHRIHRGPPAISALLVGSLCLYGYFRQIPPEVFPDGPVFALIQGNFTPEVKHDPDAVMQRLRVHETLTQKAIAYQPDFIAWPETMFPWADRIVADDVTDDDILNQLPADVVRSYGSEAGILVEPFRSPAVRQRLTHDAQACGAALLMGLEVNVAEKDSLKVFNSVAFIRPDLGYTGRYDKIHRVIFGEYIPLKSVFPFLTSLTPFGSNFGIDAGTDFKLFEYAGYRIAPMICFEDTVPHLVRRMARFQNETGKSCDIMVNLTNDAWFRGSSELDQHLITAVFRSVETRRPIVRCVNGGISAVIDGNGVIREPDRILMLDEPFEGLEPTLREVTGMRDPESGYWRRQFSGVVLSQVPLDPRESIYIRFGDIFAMICSVITLAGLVLSRRRSR